MSCLSSNALHILPKQHAALSGYFDTEIKSSVYATSTFPCAIAPTVNTTVASSGSARTYSGNRFTSGALNENPTRLAPAGKYRVTGCFTTRINFSGPLLERTLNFCNNCATSPQNRLNVLGNRVFGDTSNKTFFCVFTYIPRTFPALFNGESRIDNSAW